MSWDTPDVYYSPEHFGLTPIGQLDDPEASWSFNTFVVWKHEETGKIYYGSDSGCSCPSPFEDTHSLDGLTEVVSLHDFIDDVQDYFNSVCPWTSNYEHRETWETFSHQNNDFNNLKADALDLIQKVREA